MSGLASSLGDPYTVFFEPKTAKEFNESLAGKFEGIGAEIGIKNDQLQIIAPLPEMPAEKAGLRAGDFILKIDETDTVGMSVEKAVSLIRGPKGTEVALTIGRYKTETDKDGKETKAPETLEVKITRDTIVVRSVRSKYLDEHRLAHIEISNFNQDTAQEFSKAINDALNREVKGIILDLRNDPGGYLDRAISIAGEWTGDMVVVKERRQGKIVDEFHGTASGRLKNFPTVVLVNEGSASASEIVAGALQDYQLAKIVGKTTFGKGSVQDYQEFPDKSSIKMTIAEWVTPLERSIDKKGIVPDIEIDRTIEDYNANRDPQLDKAIELLTGKPVPKPASSGQASSTSAE
jgi:carboxyl-terminal processing protease